MIHFATLVVMQSALGATLTLSIERIVATAVGASVGALEANYFGANLVAFAVAIFLVGLLSIASRLEKTAYHYASITLTIIVLIPRSAAPWIIALNRFLEVSVGIPAVWKTCASHSYIGGKFTHAPRPRSLHVRGILGVLPSS
jgi:uncharacterized membrane protein YgaE (UPF0421/DUF939 family)